MNLTAFLGSLTIGDVKNGADITLAGAPPKLGLTTKITAGAIGDGTAIAITGAPLGRLTATSIGVGTIAAPSIGSILVKGKAKTKITAAIPGDFKSDITVTGVGVDPKKLALTSLSVLKGSITGSTIRVNGNVGSVTALTMDNTRLFAGYIGVDSGTGAFNFPSTVNSVRVTGTTKNGHPKAFAHSFLIASTFKSVSLASADTANGGIKFGVIADLVVKKMTVGEPKFTYNVKTGGTQTVAGDLQVKIV